MAAREVLHVDAASTAHQAYPSGAVFDPTGQYRYSLWRGWEAIAPHVLFVMLNPSTADAEHNDPTIRRCMGFAKSWGYGGLEVVNLFAYRATRPQDLRRSRNPVGAEGDRALLEAASRADQIILAWGNWGSLHRRDRAVLELLSGYPLHCLGLTKQQQPRHPLYLPSGAIAQDFCKI